VLLGEIEEIKKILDQKFTELDNINKKIESKEIEIDAIKSNFSREFSKINNKKNKYEERLNDYNEELVVYENMNKVYEQDEKKFNEKILQFKNSIEEFSSQIFKFKETHSDLSKDISIKEALLKKENEINAKIYLNRMRLKNTNELKQKHEQEIENLEVSIKKLEHEIVTIDSRIPTLEEEKQGYIKSKIFKEAGRVSTELANLNKTKEANVAKIAEYKEMIHSSRLNIENVCIYLNFSLIARLIA
jgi:chromosome segregation ATPase